MIANPPQSGGDGGGGLGDIVKLASMFMGKAGGGAGYSSRSDNGRRERIWYSPSCHDVGQIEMFSRDEVSA